MDNMTLLLLVVIGVIAASQLLQHSGQWILRPYVFWPVEGLLVIALGFVLLARFSPEQHPNPQIDWTIKIFLSLFLLWRLLQNWMHRQKVLRDRSADEFQQREQQRIRAREEREERQERQEGEQALVAEDEPEG